MNYLLAILLSLVTVIAFGRYDGFEFSSTYYSNEIPKGYGYTIQIMLIGVIFLSIPQSSFSQRSCPGYEYQIDYEKDIPQAYIFKTSYRLDAKGEQNIPSEYAFVAQKGKSIHLFVKEKCSDTVSIHLDILNLEKEIVISNQRESGKLSSSFYYTFKQGGLYFFRFSYDKKKCPCGYAVLSYKDEN